MEFLSLKELHRLPPLPQGQTSAQTRYITANTTAAQRLRAMGHSAGTTTRASVPSDQANVATISASLATVFMLRAVPFFSPGIRSRVLAMPSG